MAKWTQPLYPDGNKGLRNKTTEGREMASGRIKVLIVDDHDLFRTGL